MSRYAIAHAIARAADRYGLILTAGDLEIVAAWCAGQSPVAVMADGAELHCVLFRERDLWTLYRRQRRGGVITILPPHVAEPYGHLRIRGARRKHGGRHW